MVKHPDGGANLERVTSTFLFIPQKQTNKKNGKGDFHTYFEEIVQHQDRAEKCPDSLLERIP